MDSKKIVIKVVSFTSQISRQFLLGMSARMDVSYHKYGDFRANYRGQYSDAFVADLAKTLKAFLGRWEGKASGTANGNALLFALRRLLTYLAGGPTKGGQVGPGNTEYLMDAANGLGIEYECPQVKGATFTPTDDSGSTGFAGLSEREAAEYRNAEE